MKSSSRSSVSSPSSSSSSPGYVSYIYSASCSDRQFCLTGLHSASKLPGASKAHGDGFLGAVLKMTSQRQYSETGSDSDSGKGTVFSETLESPIRDDSPVLSFPNGPSCHSDDPQKRNVSKEQQQQQQQKRRIRDSETTNDDNDDDDGCPTSPAFPVDCDFQSESPSKASCSSEESGRGSAGYGSVFPVERLRHGRPDGDVTPVEERHDTQYPSFDPKISDINNNNNKKKDSKDDLGEFSSKGCHEFTPDIEGHVSGSGRNHLIYGQAEEESKTGSLGDLKTVRPLLKAKCQDFYEARNNGLGSREICLRGAPGVRQRGDQDDQSASRLYGHVAARDVISSDPNSLGAASRRYVTTDCFYDDRHCDVSYGRHLTLSDSLSTVYDRCFSPSIPSGESPHGRLQLRHPVSPHAASRPWESPSRPSGRYAKRPKATSPYSTTLGSDSRLHTGPGAVDTPRPPMNPSEYRRVRSTSYEYASSGAAWKGADDPQGQNQSKGPLGLHPAMQQPFLDEASATYPRPNKSGARTAAAVATGGPAKDRQRRWTNSGAESGMTGTPSQGSPPSAPQPRSRWTRWLSLSSMLRPKRNASVSRPETGSETEAFRTEGGEGRGSAASVSRYSSSQSVFEMVDLDPSSSASVPTTPTKTGGFLRSPSAPYPGGSAGSVSGISFLQKIRSRFAMTSNKKAFTSSTDDVTDSGQQQQQQQQHTAQQQRNGDDHVTGGQTRSTMIGCDEGMGGDSVPVAKATRTLGRFISLQESSPDEREPKGHVTDFATLQAQKGKAHILREYHEEAGGKCATKQSEDATPPGEFRRNCEDVVAPPGEVADALLELKEFALDVSEYAASGQSSGDRTILEEDFNGYRRDMINSVKDFIDRCKLMVVKTPASEPGFLEELTGCRRLLGRVFDRYRALVDCTSLPADRERFAGGVGAVAASFRATVVAASEAAGRRARHPAVRRLRSAANRLVADLTNLMKLVREMNYNRLSRRF